jgi:hypothetical protein
MPLPTWALVLLAGAVSAQATQADYNWYYNYTIPAVDPMVVSSVNTPEMTPQWAVNGDKLECTMGAACSKAYFQFPLFGNRFCVYGDPNPSMNVNFRVGSSFRGADYKLITTDGTVVCSALGDDVWNATAQYVVLAGAKAVEKIVVEIPTRLPDK